MILAILKAVHVLCVVVWIGGMVFAHFFLRPAVMQLDPPTRLRLMHDVLGRFFQAVLVASLATLISGVSMMLATPGGTRQMPWTWTVMALVGTLMVAIFMHIRFALFQRLARAVNLADGAGGGAAMTQIRQWVTVNLGLGIAVLLTILLG